MVGHGSKQPRKKAQAIAALLGHPSVAEAAGAIDVAPQTLNRWLSEPEFSRQYRAARRAEYRQSMTRLAQGATAAVKSALQIMYRGKKAATRFKAAKFVIRFCIEGSEIEDSRLRWRRRNGSSRRPRKRAPPPLRSRTKATGQSSLARRNRRLRLCCPNATWRKPHSVSMSARRHSITGCRIQRSLRHMPPRRAASF